jgi:hypothetical protein
MENLMAYKAQVKKNKRPHVDTEYKPAIITDETGTYPNTIWHPTNCKCNDPHPNLSRTL